MKATIQKLTRSARRAMTLVEILIAIGVLAVGMMSICALLPLGIRNTASSVDKTVAASVAKTVVASLKYYSIDLTSGLDAFIGGQKLADAGSLAKAIYDYHMDGLADTPPGRIIGIYPLSDGEKCRPFMIPQDVLLDPDMLGGAAPHFYVKYYDDSTLTTCSYGWTATLMPALVVDDDGDGRCDEDWPDGLDNDGNNGVDEDPPHITQTSAYRMQIAVWRVGGGLLDLGDFDYLAAITMSNGSKIITVKAGTEGDKLLRLAKPGDYVMREYHGLWYRIAVVDESNRKIILEKRFYTPFLPQDTPLDVCGHLKLASRFRLVALYDALIAP